MEGSILFMIFLQVFLIALNAVFACAEIAVISMNDGKLAKLVAEGDRRALRLARLTSQPARFLATIQVAITLSEITGVTGDVFDLLTAATHRLGDRLSLERDGVAVLVPSA